MSAPLDDMEPHLDALSEDEAPHAPAGFVIDSDGKAEWAAELVLASENGVERREAGLLRFKAEDKKLREFFLPLLAEYFEKHPPRSGKTLKLANANLSMRTVAGGLRITDEAAVIAWARKHLPKAIVPSFVENLDREIVRRHFDEVGEVPDGCEIKDDEERLYVKAPKAPKEVK